MPIVVLYLIQQNNREQKQQQNPRRDFQITIIKVMTRKLLDEI